MLLIILALATAEAPPSSGGSLPKPVQPEKWITYGDYPVPALRKREEGTAWFEVSVDPGGKPYDCQILVSSGHKSLDQRSCSLMLSRGRFQPGLDAGGLPIPGTYRRAASWWQPPSPAHMTPPPKAARPVDAIIPVSRLPAGVKADVIIRAVETESGSVESCSIETSSNNDQLDRIACSQVSGTKFESLKGPDGGPTRSIRIRRIEFRPAG
jgi:TonB family protein